MFEAKLVAGEGPQESKEAPFSMDIKRFSSLTKLCRVTAWVSRLIDKLRKKTNLSGPLKAAEINKAETMWTAYVQSTEYHSVIDSIQKKKIQQSESSTWTLHGQYWTHKMSR